MMSPPPSGDSHAERRHAGRTMRRTHTNLVRGAASCALAVVVFASASLVDNHLHGPVTAMLARVSLPRGLIALVALTALTGAVRSVLAWRAWRAPALSPWGAALALGLVVGLSASLWRVLGTEATLPRILGDELLYTDLGHGIARGDGFVVRGVTERGYGIGYPLFLAPFYALARDAVSAYAAIQTAQALVMASVAFPVYLLARRVVSREWALVCASLSVAVPELFFSTLVMTEPLSYAASAWFFLAATLALETPTPRRQLATCATLALACSIRYQGVALAGALVSAILVMSFPCGPGPTLRRWAPTLWLLGVVGSGVVALAVATDVQPLGAYSTLAAAPDLWGTLIWSMRSVAAVALTVGIVTVAALVPALARLFRAGPAGSAVAALTVGVLVWTVGVVGHFSSTPWGFDHVHERNLFTVVPLVVVAGTAGAVAGLRGRAVPAVVGAIATVASLASLRQRDLTAAYDVDMLSLLPWRDLGNGAPSASHAVLFAGLVGASLALVTRRAWVLAATAATAMLVALPVPSSVAPRGATKALSWVDEAAGRDAHVLVVTAGVPDVGCDWRAPEELALWTEFFNVSSDRAAHLYHDNRTANLRSPRLELADDGTLLDAGRPLDVRLVAIDDRVVLAGSALARLPANVLGDHPGARAGLTLWSVHGSPRVLDVARVRGLRPSRACETHA